jgi:hypothetical protein
VLRYWHITEYNAPAGSSAVAENHDDVQTWRRDPDVRSARERGPGIAGKFLIRI